MRRKISAALVVALTTMLPGAAEAAGTIHCVPVIFDVACGDAHPTIQDATSHASAGDTVLVAPGTYAGFTIPAGVSVRSVGGPGVTRIVDATSQAVAPVPAPALVVSYADGVTLEGFELRSLDRQETLTLIGANSVIRNNIITGTRNGGRPNVGMVVNDVSTGMVIEGNEIFNFVTAAYFNPIVRGTKWFGNRFHDNGTGIRMGGSEGGFQDNLFLGNSFVDNNWGVRLGNPNDPAPYAWGTYPSQPANGVNTFRRNCFSGNAGGAIFVGDQNVVTQDARGNHFGAPDGASGAGGSGDAVQGSVDASMPDPTCGISVTESARNPHHPGASGPAVLRENGIYRMWMSRGGGLSYSESADAVNWTNAQTVTIPGYSGRIGSVTVARTGGALRIWWANTNGSVPYTDPDYYAIYTSASLDDGASWAAPTRVTFIGGPAENGKPANDLYQLSVIPKVDNSGLWGYLNAGGQILRLETVDLTGASGWTNAQTVLGPPMCSTQCVSAMVTRDATGYRLWFSTYQGTDTDDQDTLWMAVSVDGLRFVVQPAPLLHADDGVAWRSSRTSKSWAVARGRGFDVFYSGRDAAGNFGIGVASTSPLPLTVVDCGLRDDDPRAIQAVIDSIGAGGTIRLRGTCDLTKVGAAGSTPNGVSTAALIVPSTSVGLTITSDDPAAPATLLGSGTQAGIFVAPGATDTTITGLNFTSLARPIVAVNSTNTTIGAASDPDSGFSAGQGNRILGGAATDAGILAVGEVSGSSISVRAGSEPAARSFATPVGQRLEGLKVYGNLISIRPPGPDAIGISVRHRAAGDVRDVDIAANAVGLFAADMPSPNQVGIRIWSEAGDPNIHISDVLIRANNLGRLEELDLVGAGDVHATGRFGILVNRAGDVTARGNGVRARLSRTPGFDFPGGGIVYGNVMGGAIEGNGIIVLADDGTSANDAGAIGIIHGFNRLLASSGQGPGTGSISVTNNIIGPATNDLPVGAQRGLVVDGASNITATGNRFKKVTDYSIRIGATLRGFNSSLLSVSHTSGPVKASSFCGNWLNTLSVAPADRDTPASQVRFVAGIGSTGNSFPKGFVYAANSGC
ncbi:MAG: NosD domain-containing protein [Actinomycetota bacterium]